MSRSGGISGTQSGVIVFVHGVPETAGVWDGVRRAVAAAGGGDAGSESMAVGLPGFGTPRPTGFGANKDEYVDWLVGELDAVEGPIDLVGHDWGALLVFRVASAHGDRLRSWAIDCGNLAHPDYEWHEIAKVWQTPDQGEAFVAAMTAQTPEEQAPGLEALGVPREHALAMAAASDATMGACILDLYRSATPNPHATWGPLVPTSAPGLIVHSTADPFSDEALARGVADALGARFATLDGIGHFWPYQAPEAAAALLSSFWSSLT
jgi:pimeloyl-ACP methyl ester carboxylesterase